MPRRGGTKPDFVEMPATANFAHASSTLLILNDETGLTFGKSATNGIALTSCEASYVPMQFFGPTAHAGMGYVVIEQRPGFTKLNSCRRATDCPDGDSS
jgi:hypothetical protein